MQLSPAPPPPIGRGIVTRLHVVRAIREAMGDWAIAGDGITASEYGDGVHLAYDPSAHLPFRVLYDGENLAVGYGLVLQPNRQPVVPTIEGRLLQPDRMQTIRYHALEPSFSIWLVASLLTELPVAPGVPGFSEHPRVTGAELRIFTLTELPAEEERDPRELWRWVATVVMTNDMPPAVTRGIRGHYAVPGVLLYKEAV